MKLNIVAVSFIVSAIWVAAGQDPRPGAKTPLAGNAAAARAGGERVARSCPTCHGVDGRAPSLATGAFTRGGEDDQTSPRTIRGGIPGRRCRRFRPNQMRSAASRPCSRRLANGTPSADGGGGGGDAVAVKRSSPAGGAQRAGGERARQRSAPISRLPARARPTSCDTSASIQACRCPAAAGAAPPASRSWRCGRATVDRFAA